MKTIITPIFAFLLIVGIGIILGMLAIELRQSSPVNTEVVETPPIAPEILLVPTIPTPTMEPTAEPVLELQCLDLDMRIATIIAGEFQTVGFGEAVLCTGSDGQWYISSTYGPSIEAHLEGGGKVIVRPWDGPQREYD